MIARDEPTSPSGSPAPGPSGSRASPDRSERAADAREAAAERLLAEHGVRASRVEAAGHRAEIAAVCAPAQDLARVRELAPRIKALGFKYVALDPLGESRDG